MSDLYFAYGSNMSSARLRDRIGEIRVVATARLAGHRLAFNKRSRDGTGKANLIAAPESETWGVVWAIAPASWGALDRFEPDYRRTRCDVVAGSGEVLGVQIYLHDGHPAAIAPDPAYVDLLLAGAREHGLPNAYVAAVIALARAARATRDERDEVR